jgi:hypothetical protein
MSIGVLKLKALCLLGCYAIFLGKYCLRFPRIRLPSLQGQAPFPGLFDPDNEGTTYLQNDRNYNIPKKT